MEKKGDMPFSRLKNKGRESSLAGGEKKKKRRIERVGKTAVDKTTLRETELKNKRRKKRKEGGENGFVLRRCGTRVSQ